MRKSAAEIVNLLKQRGETLSVAESFTGGMLSKAIISVPGASAVFFEGAVCYSLQAKQLRLGVKPETLQTFGAVSRETAEEMALGLIKTGACTFAVATTGSAGPLPDGSAPVGTFYIAVADRFQVKVYEHFIQGDRKKITREGTRIALTHLLNRIKNS